MRHPTLWFAGLAVLLASCNPQPTPPETKPVQGSLYQVNFSLLDSSSGTASLKNISPKGLSAQELTNAPEPLSINADRTVVSTFITKKNGVDVRHIHSTFEVTNNTTQTLSNLTFLPVIRADADSDPSNNTQTPTVPGTPFLNVQLFDGTDASAQAPAFQTVQAQNVDLATGLTVTAPNSSPYLTNLDVSKLSVSVAPGLTSSVMNKGWVASTSLAPGATTKLTIAVEYPADRKAPKTQPFTFSMLMTAAQDVSGTSVGPALDPAHIQGIIQNWTFGAGENLHSTFRSSQTNLSVTPLVTGIATDGSVDGHLSTPPSSTLQPLFGNYCPFTGEQSASDLNYVVANLVAISGGGDTLGPVLEWTSSGMVLRMYSDTTAHFKGTGCGSDIDLSVVRGWNILVSWDDAGVRYIRNLAPGISTMLTFSPLTEKLLVNQNDFMPFSLYAGGASVSRSVQLIQQGGISGDITVETSVPGVSVTPSTISLPSLSAASLSGGLRAQGILKAQSLNTDLTFSASIDAPSYYGNLDVIFKKNSVEVARISYYGFSLLVPSVSVSMTSPYGMYGSTPTLAMGDTLDVPVMAYSQNTFSGPVIFTLTNLPAGITATTETVSLAANGSSQATIKLSADSTAAFQTFTAQLKATGPNIINYTSQTSFSVKVVPQRYNLNLAGFNITGTAPAQGGLWITGTQAGVRKVLRVQSGSVIQNETLTAPGPEYNYPFKLLPTPNGNVIAIFEGMGDAYSQLPATVTLIRTDGTQLSYILPDAPGISSGIADASGNIWFNKTIYDGSGKSPLVRLNMTTGTIATIDDTHSFSGYKSISPDGNIFSVINGSTGFQINTATSTITPIIFSQPFSSSVYWTANTGDIYTTSYAGISHATPSGTVTTIIGTSNISSIYGFDRLDSSILWIGGSSGAVKLNLTNQEQTPADTQSIGYANVDLNGGLWEMLPFYNTTYQLDYYLSYLR